MLIKAHADPPIFFCLEMEKAAVGKTVGDAKQGAVSGVTTTLERSSILTLFWCKELVAIGSAMSALLAKLPATIGEVAYR